MSDTRRVLLVLGHSAGGIARHVGQIVCALDHRDGLALDIAGPPSLPLRMPKPLLPVVIPDGLRGHASAVGDLRHMVAGRRYDIVHAHGLRAGIDAALGAMGLDTPVLVTVHNLVRREVIGARSLPLRWSEPLMLRLSTHTFAVSEDIATRLRKAVPAHAHKVEVLHLGVGEVPTRSRRPEEARGELLAGGHGRLVVVVARLQPQKALDVALRAVAGMSPDVTLAIFGEGPQDARLRSLATELGISGRVRFMGFRSDVADYVAAADVFCLSSRWEGVPLAAQEAILLRVPVVATDVGGMRELIDDRFSGRLVPRDDPGALARALTDVLDDADAAGTYAARAGEHLYEAFSTTSMLERLEQAYRTEPGAAH